MDWFQQFTEKISTSRWNILLVVVLYLVLASTIALVQMPVEDDMIHVNVTNSLLTKGRLACPVYLPLSYCHMKGCPSVSSPVWYKCDQYYYPTPPGAYIFLAGWMKVFGVGFFQYKFFNVLFGLIGLLCWWQFFKKIGVENKRTLFVTVFLIATSFIYTRFTSCRSQEAMDVALLALALLSYVHWRTTSLSKAILFSQIFVALSCTIHPNGLVAWAETTFLILYLDRGRLKWKYLFYYFLPYLLFGTAILIFIFQDFEIFKLQFGTVIHVAASESFWGRIRATFSNEFFEAYGLTQASPSSARVLSFILLLNIVSYFILFKNRKEGHLNRLILILSAIHLFFFTFVFTHKWSMYVIYFVPLFSVATALAWQEVSDKYPRFKPLISNAILISILLSIMVNVYRLKRNMYWNVYHPDLKAIKAILSPEDIVCGPAELGFEIPLNQLSADVHLGYFNKLKPTVVVMDEFASIIINKIKKTHDAEVRAYMEEIFSHLELAYKGKYYNAYRYKK